MGYTTSFYPTKKIKRLCMGKTGTDDFYRSFMSFGSLNLIDLVTGPLLGPSRFPETPDFALKFRTIPLNNSKYLLNLNLSTTTINVKMLQYWTTQWMTEVSSFWSQHLLRSATQKQSNNVIYDKIRGRIKLSSKVIARIFYKLRFDCHFYLDIWAKYIHYQSN